MACLLYLPIPSPINIIRKKPLPSPNHYCIQSAPPKSSRFGQIGNFAAGINPVCSSVAPKVCLGGTPKCSASGIEHDLEPELVPKHVGIIMDGHRRWAKSKGVSKLEGYEIGTRNLLTVVSQLFKCGVQTVTVFNFHPGSWTRAKEDVDFFLKLGDEMIQTNIDEMMRRDLRVTVMGNRSRFPPSLQELIRSMEERAKNNKGPHVVLAMDYTGRYDITEAAKKIAGKVKDGVLDVGDIDETLFEQHLQTSGLQFPNPDLLIRSGGKFKLSNFMLWQMAQTELYVSDKMFPDINEEDVVEALAEYQRRHKCVGAT